jgi:TonB family protein
MKPILAILVLTVSVSLDVGAQDVRSKVGPTSETSFTNIIDPDGSIYGAQWGVSEDEFIGKYGNPTGYIRLNGTETAMIYGKNHAFIFTASKLSGVRISSTVFDWKLSQALLTLTPLDGIRWQLSNGIRLEMNLAEVKKILGESLKTDSYQRYFNSDKARVEIDFYRLSSEGEKDEAYRLSGIYIRQATPGAAQKAPVPARPYQPRIPETTQPCTAEVAKWWQEVRAAAIQVWAGRRYYRLNTDTEIEAARMKYTTLLREGQAKAYKPPVEDIARPVVLYLGGPPGYTKQARENKIKGKIKLQVESLADGRVGEVRIISGLGYGLDEVAIKAIREMVFLPAVKDGVFTTVWTSADIEFDLR